MASRAKSAQEPVERVRLSPCPGTEPCLPLLKQLPQASWVQLPILVFSLGLHGVLGGEGSSLDTLESLKQGHKMRIFLAPTLERVILRRRMQHHCAPAAGSGSGDPFTSQTRGALQAFGKQSGGPEDGEPSPAPYCSPHQALGQAMHNCTGPCAGETAPQSSLGEFLHRVSGPQRPLLGLLGLDRGNGAPGTAPGSVQLGPVLVWRSCRPRREHALVHMHSLIPVCACSYVPVHACALCVLMSICVFVCMFMCSSVRARVCVP